MNKAFVDYYCCPEEFVDLRGSNVPPEKGGGYFRFGPELICYGRSELPVCELETDVLPDALRETHIEDKFCRVPFNPSEVAASLRYERYVQVVKKPTLKAAIHRMYYAVRPILPVFVRRHLQKLWLSRRESATFPHWPVDSTVDRMFEVLMSLLLEASPGTRIPFIWFWPEGKSSCAMMTHDVETSAGLSFVDQLMDMDDSFGIKSSFQLIPNARYSVNRLALEHIRARGFEANCHDLKHDGHLFEDHLKFQSAAGEINAFVKEFQYQGFRSGALYRNQEWMSELKVSYDMSVPNVARFDPQPGGCCTVMPYFISDLLELPVTMIQDYTLFHVLGDYSMDIWNKQINCMMRQHGLMNFIVHPDYLAADAAQNTYKALLARLKDLRSHADLWVALPGEVNRWWRERAAMKLVRHEDRWNIEGPGSESACVAYAFLRDNKVCYELESMVCQ